MAAGADTTRLVADSSQANGVRWAAETELKLIAAKGDLTPGTANDTRAVLAAGVDGLVLTTDATQTTGLAWRDPTPAGVTAFTVAAAAPTGWWLLDGSTKVNAQTLQPNLWAVAPVAWRSGANLILPDARGRTVVAAGTGAGLSARALGSTFGEESHTLTAAESGTAVHLHSITDPTHTHTSNAGTDTDGVGNGVRPSSGLVDQLTATINAASTGITATNNHAGASAASAHNVVQPSIAFNIIVKT